MHFRAIVCTMCPILVLGSHDRYKAVPEIKGLRGLVTNPSTPGWVERSSGIERDVRGREQWRREELKWRIVGSSTGPARLLDTSGPRWPLTLLLSCPELETLLL